MLSQSFYGCAFLKRQWMLGKNLILSLEKCFQNILSPIQSDYLLVAMVFSVPYLGIQLRASGFLFNVLTDGMLGVNVGMILLSLVVVIYVASGGLRAVAYVDTMQCVLLAGGIITLGLISFYYIGGLTNLTQGIVALSQSDTKLTQTVTSHYVAIQE